MPKSISNIVEELISSNPCISYLLSSGIVNYSSLAALLQPAVNELSNSQVRLNTIVQALRRIALTKPENYSSIAKALTEADYNLYQNVNEFAFYKKDVPEVLSKISKSSHTDTSVLILFLSGDTLTLVVDDKTAAELHMKQNAAKYTLLKISIKQSVKTLPGSSAFIAQALGTKDISPQNIMRKGNEIFVLFEEKQFGNALEAIKLLQHSALILK